MPDVLPLKVLIADDHFLTRQIVADVMRAHNVGHIATAVDGREARDAIARAQSYGSPFDVVFLDWHMPLIEGVDILRLFRAQPAANNTIFIMLTAAAERREVLEAVKAGASGYIVKPASKDVINKKFLEAVEWAKKKKSEIPSGHS